MTSLTNGAVITRGAALEDDPDVLAVVLADPQALFRESVRIALSSDATFKVVGEARGPAQAIARIVESSADVAVIDENLTSESDLVHEICERVPTCRVLVVSAHEDDAVLASAMVSGASGYLSKQAPLVDLVSAMRTIHEGGTVVPPMMLGRLLATFVSRRDARDEAFRRIARLTPRERQVLALIAQGADKYAIASELVISPHTARTHVQSVLSKLDVHSRLEAMSLVVRTEVLRELETLIEFDGQALRSAG
ncbi:MAG TPA: response regulator transcription factor [Actinomycetota bacterium]|nr:response regulator transcription factor [Actinomycetota bacterium]